MVGNTMSRQQESRSRAQSLGEEIANSVSHGVGLIAAMAGGTVLAITAIRRGDTASIIGACVFATTMVLLYLASTLYHALPRGKAKRVFRILDHSAIYLLIAGSYTPFALGVLRGAWGWTLLGMVYALAISGIVLKATRGARNPVLSTCLYLAMGWLVVIAAKPLILNVPPWGLFWLVAGGLAYTGGLAFFVAKRIRYSHFVWHLFVAAGTTCHFIAILGYAV